MQHSASSRATQVPMSEEIVAAENSMRMSSNTVAVVLPDDADTQVSRIALAYSAKEVTSVQQLFGLLAVNQFPYAQNHNEKKRRNKQETKRKKKEINFTFPP
jgi:hypothetical protein